MLTESRLRLAEARERLERHDALAPLRGWLLELGEREIHLVERVWRGAERPGVRRTAVAVSWLGNGLAYLPLAVILLLTVPGVVRPLAVAGLCVLIAHLIYPWAKLACCRARPCELRRELAPRLALLDRHSFPSGHAMTLSAALVPLLAAHPASWPAAAGAWLLMGWSRVACAHH
ncbi:MAG: phosphatase PAP2 family protein, partial [Novosphingobium sp.]